MHIIITEDDIRGYDWLWLIGDNFGAKSYRNFKLVEQGKELDERFYIKDNFEYLEFFNSRYSSTNTNMLSRLQTTMATAINKCKDHLLPKYIIVVLDDDLISFLDFKHDGAATLLGSWIDWIATEFQSLIDQKKSFLPAKKH